MIKRENNENDGSLTKSEIESMFSGAEHLMSSMLVLQKADYGSLDDYLSEVKWSKLHRHTAIYKDFLNELESVSLSEIRTGNSSIYLKMRFSYAVTLMESCLSEMIKAVTMQYEAFRCNAIKNINDLKTLRIYAPDLLDKNPKDILDNAIMGHLTHVIYHNMDKVSKVYTDVIGEQFPSVFDEGNKVIRVLTELRHDIVHRNGKNRNGEEINIDLAQVDSCISHIRTFVEGVHEYIDRNVKKISEKTD
ncbi:hypothetical protein [Pantoea anthophila]|uniref:hypothetical protein n=1 Tax=Pantoea anthophila TaxID=470931 RepID=UPI000614E082|nr:hypothetical protein [Pantoea anthophila]KKB02709.1 hypothetical protein TN98_20945 [Pantoea anthophila]